MKKLKKFLDSQYNHFNAKEYLKLHPDPIIIAHKNTSFAYFDELALICALYAYGNANLIVKNLQNMPFNFLLDSKKLQDSKEQDFPYYRFQTRRDTQICFFVMSHLISKGGIKKIFLSGYKNGGVLNGIRALQKEIEDFLNTHNFHSHGLEFLFGKSQNNTSPLKRYNMFLRWLVRCDDIDFGLWSEISTSDLLLPLDTHTFRLTKELNLCNTRSYNIKAVIEVTNNLKNIDSKDPIKYDFALYRIGQLGLKIPNFN